MNSLNIRALAWRFRYLAITIICLALFATAINTLSEFHPPTSPVIITTRTIPAGSTLHADDLDIAEIPTDLIPDGVLTSIDQAENQILTSTLPQGIPLAQSVLLGETFLDTAPHGHIIAPIEAANSATLDIIQPGQYLSLYSPPNDYSLTTDASLIAHDILLAGIATQTTQSNLLTQGTESTTLFVSIPKEEAPAILGASSIAPLIVVATS